MIDSHVHIFKKWAGILNGLPVSSESYGKIKIGNDFHQVMPPAYERTDSPLDILIANLEYHDVQKALLMSNGGYGYNNEYLKEGVDRYPEKFKALALVDITNGLKASEEITRYVSQGFIGIKIETLTAFQCSGELKLDDDRIIPVWECCDSLGIIVMLHMSRKDDIEAIERIVNRYKNIKLIFAHYGAETVFKGNSKSNEQWNRLLQIVKMNENIWLETSSLSNFLGESISFTKTINMIEESYNTLGAEKILWGSDYPCMMLFATYQQLIDILNKGCKNIPPTEVEKILGGNALKLFWN